ncbi:sulfatase-like hydrolase/transferase, partial [Candidatus Aminicenantes bacterium AH-873-B07]|nr:sulfatase-like hydrolase/transferase [Candidatus Aminicenantes bacterium AH-873-B07]
IDKFLLEAIIFKNCYTPLARTFPSWISVLTGKYPKTHGARYNLIKRKFMNSNCKTLGEILKEKFNYFTAYFTDETRFSNILKQDGFDYLRQPIMGVKDFTLGNFHDFSLANVFFNNPMGYKLFDFLDINRGVAHLYKNKYFTDELISFLNILKTKEKFLLMVHFCAPHWPYILSAPYPYLFRNNKNTIIGEYDGALKMADEQVGRLIKALKKYQLYDNSIVILLSDHGESFDYFIGHGIELRSDAQNRVIFALKLPKENKHFEVKELVRIIDITPTLLDLINLDIRAYNFEGKSLKPFIFGKKFNDENYVFLETGFSLDGPGGVTLTFEKMISKGITFYEFDKRGIITIKENLHEDLIRYKQRAIMNEKWKLILEPNYKGEMEVFLYNLRDDPECKNNVIKNYPEIARKLLNKLTEYYSDEIYFVLKGSYLQELSL